MCVYIYIFMYIISHSFAHFFRRRKIAFIGNSIVIHFDLRIGPVTSVGNFWVFPWGIPNRNGWFIMGKSINKWKHGLFIRENLSINPQ